MKKLRYMKSCQDLTFSPSNISFQCKLRQKIKIKGDKVKSMSEKYTSGIKNEKVEKITYKRNIIK